MDEATLQRFGASLQRCTDRPGFLELFYDLFLASSPLVREKFAATDFVKQREALRSSLGLMLRAARQDGAEPPTFLDHLAQRHGASQLGVGSAYYDLWLDSLLAAVKATDPQWTPEVALAWEGAMGIGIRYLLSRYNA
jgi:hypothetical protein